MGFLHDLDLIFLVGRLTLMNGLMTHPQNHCWRQPLQQHLYLEFNLDAFYLHYSQHRATESIGLPQAPVDLLKTTFSTRSPAYDPEAVHFKQCCSSLL